MDGSAAQIPIVMGSIGDHNYTEYKKDEEPTQGEKGEGFEQKLLQRQKIMTVKINQQENRVPKVALDLCQQTLLKSKVHRTRQTCR